MSNRFVGKIAFFSLSLLVLTQCSTFRNEVGLTAKTYGDFTKDVVYDPYFPIFADHSVITAYLGASSQRILEIFEELWNEYKA